MTLCLSTADTIVAGPSPRREFRSRLQDMRLFRLSSSK